MSSVSFTVRRPSPVSNDSSDIDPSLSPKPSSALRRIKDEHAPRTSSPLNPNSNGKRKLAFDDSDDEEEDVTEELVIGFDALGAKR
jgi:hypothetical protein